MNYKKLRKLAEHATSGPWFRCDKPFECPYSGADTYEVGPIPDRLNNEQDEDAICQVFGTEHDSAANGAYIAACDPVTIIGLLDEIARLKKKLKEKK
jgi:hypothetical protein